jgi:3D (Asp-Asp-Asp) domain-containing protein
MHYANAYRFFGCLVAALSGATLFTSCTTNSLTALSNQNIQAVSKIAQEEPAAETLTVGSDAGAAPGSATIVGAPTAPAATDAPAVTPLAATASAPLPEPAVDQVAQEKPAQPAAAPVVLATVPRTPVANRPTNQIMMVRTTAYSHVEADHLVYGRKSAAGTNLQYGSRVRSAAADWSKYPLGTRFTIEGLPYEYVVDDYGSALVGTETIDIYKPEAGTMNKWGVRNVPIKVLEWGSFEESRKILDGRKHVRHADHVRKMLSEIEKKGRTGYATPASGGSA